MGGAAERSGSQAGCMCTMSGTDGHVDGDRDGSPVRRGQQAQLAMGRPPPFDVAADGGPEPEAVGIPEGGPRG
jgi:hypothetical protein